MNDRIKLEEYIKEKYDVPTTKGIIRNKLLIAVHNDIDMGILLNLFKAKENDLNLIRANNVAKGKVLTGEALFFYEFAIILSWYPDYVRKIKVLEKQNKELSDTHELGMLIESAVKNKKQDEKLRDLSGFIDDIFFLEERE